MAPITKESVGKAVAAELPRFFRDTVDQLREGEGQYLSTGDPDSYISKIGQAVGRAACRRFGQNPGALDSDPATRFERACRPYLDRIGQGQGGKFGPPFRGGQCVANYNVSLPSTNYRIRITVCATGVIEFEGPGTSRGISNVPGPILGVFGRSTLSGNCGSNNLVLVVIGADGVERLGGTLGSTTATRRVELVAFDPVIVRTDGLPDNCGNPPDPEGNPLPGPNPQPEPVRYTDGDDVNIDITTNILPNGSITFNIGGGPVTVDPFADPDGGGGGFGPDGDPAPPGFQGDPSTPIDVGPGGAADQTDPGRNLIGVKVQTIQRPPRANQVFNPTETYTKGSYFVYFGGAGGLALNPDGAIARQDQFFYAPKGANRFRVVPNAGFTIRVTPYYEDD